MLYLKRYLRNSRVASLPSIDPSPQKEANCAHCRLNGHPFSYKQLIVTDHCPLTGKHKQAARRKSNVNMTEAKTTSVPFFSQTLRF